MDNLLVFTLANEHVALGKITALRSHSMLVMFLLSSSAVLLLDADQKSVSK